MNAPLVSVLIDTYNYGKYVEEAVASALAQDFPAAKREILVVDDGSTDDTAERVSKFGEGIRYLRKANGGQASAFNYGFEHARGEIIALLDADDVWLPGKLKHVCETFDRNPEAAMVYHRVHWWRGGEEMSEDTYFVPVSGRVPEDRAALLRYAMAETSCLAFRRATLEKLLPVPEALRTQADAYLTALIIFVAPVVALSEYLGKYRLHETNLFQSSSERTSRCQIEYRMAMRSALLHEIQLWLERHGHDVQSPNLRDYLKQWSRAQEAERFVLNAPSRWKYFRHLLEHPRIYGINMTARHRTYSYVRAFGALALGYRHLHVVDDARGRWKQLFRSASKGPFRPQERKVMAAKN